jgi:uncharacterized protein with GYD domain
MPTFICSLNWTDKGVRSIQDAPRRRELAKGVAGKLGINLTSFYITSGDCDVLIIMEAPDGDVVAKFAIIIASQGNVYVRTARAFPESEFTDLINTVTELRVQ